MPQPAPAEGKIDLTTFDPVASELFSAFDHLLRATQTQGSDHAWHLQWCHYHYKRFRNALGPRDDAEQPAWEGISTMIRALLDRSEVR